MSSSSKYIVIEDGSMSVNLKSGGIQVTTEALQTLKLIGCTYGLYSSYEDMNDYRVMYQEEPHPMLIVQNNTSYHGSPYWETIEVLTQNPQEVEAYLKFKRLVKSIRQKEIEDEKIVESLKVRREQYERMQNGCETSKNEQRQASYAGPQMNL